MKAMVIGGAGFIGSHLCEALIETGYEVACVDNFYLGTKENIAHLLTALNFRLIEADASKKDELSKIFGKFKPDIVYHLAANSDIQASAKNPVVEYENTYSTTFQILNCMKNYGVKKFFFASTSAVYGNKNDTILDENTANLSPISYYGAAKLGSEALISAFSYMNDMKSLVFRFPNVIGPRLTHGVIYDFLRKLQKDSFNLEILGNGRQTKPYIYVTDLIAAIIKFTENLDVNHDCVTLYNVGVKGSTSVKNIADIFCEEMNLQNVEYHFTGGEGGWKGDVPKFQYCLDKIHKAGWQANFSSDEAVRKTIQELLKDEKK